MIELPAMLPALPEIVLATVGMVLLMAGAFGGEGTTRWITWATIFSIVVAALLVPYTTHGRVLAFGGLFVTDPFAVFMKELVLIGSGLTLILSLDFNERERIGRFEYPILILYATVGMMMMVSANDLISLYIGLELQSLCLYVVAAFRRDTLRSSEAGLKYFVLGALSSGHAALRRLDDLRLLGHHALRRAGRYVRRDGRARLHRPHHRHRLRLGRARLQARGRPLPHVDARRLRGCAHAGHGLLRRGAQDGGRRPLHSRDDRAVRQSRRPMATDRGVHLHRLHAARRLRRNMADQHQAAHGL